MDADVKISIIMPMRNAAKWVDACIESIQAQSFKEWQLIVVDDHSTDDSYNHVAHRARSDERILLLKNRSDGIIPALQRAFSFAEGRFITRMDADDLMPAQKLERFYQAACDHPNHVITGKVSYFHDGGGSVSEGYQKYERWLNERVDRQDHWTWIYRECVIASANWMAHRSMVNLADLTYPEDYDLVFRWYQAGIPVLGIPHLTHRWREHPLRTSRNSPHYQQERFFQLKLEHFVRIDRNSQQPLFILGNNVKSKLSLRILEGLDVSCKVIKHEEVHRVEWHDDAQVLIAVYPEIAQRQLIEAFLTNHGLKQGKNYWWI